MGNTPTVKVRVLRPLHYRGERIPAGAELHLAPLEARDLLASSRAELVDALDRKVVNEAIAAETDRITPRVPVRRLEPAEPAPWWRRYA
jgi:hypothetical protein